MEVLADAAHAPAPRRLTVMALLILAAALPLRAASTTNVDVCVYAATPSGILAAVTVKRAGHSVVIVEPSRWVGGMLGAGLKPMQDCPNYAATGGMTRELLLTLGNDPGATAFKSSSRISPKVVRDDFAKLLQAEGVDVVYEHRISRCEKRDTNITKAVFDLAPFDELGCPVPEPKTRDNLSVTAKVFIDASYEGDLMPASGVSFRVGRESQEEFNEPASGVQPPLELTPIDPFVEPGKPDSGLLKWVENDHGKPAGAADGYTQAYNYRYYTTAVPEDRVEIPAPDNYDPKDFELVGRYVEYLVQTVEPAKLRERLVAICPGWKNSGEWNYQRASLITMAPLGISQLYADGDHATKARVWKQHQDYLKGLFHFMRTDPRVPQSYRDEIAQLGLDGRYHPETKGWPHQLYVRVARRLLGGYTITAHDVYNKTTVEDSVGLAQYGIDTYPARRIWIKKDGNVLVGIEGKMFVGGNRGPTDIPYPISYRSLTPRAQECTNLLVPVCFSATHLGYASARMEPVFMISGQSVGTAASMAIKLGVPVQEVPYAQLAEKLKADGQLLVWTKGASPSVQPPVAPLKLVDGIVVDDKEATFTGDWASSTRNPQFVGTGYRTLAKGAAPGQATYTAKLPKPGRYEVRLYFAADDGRATNLPVTIKHSGGDAGVTVDQSRKPEGDGTYRVLGAFAFGESGTVVLSNQGVDGWVIADAVQFVPVE